MRVLNRILLLWFPVNCDLHRRFVAGCLLLILCSHIACAPTDTPTSTAPSQSVIIYCSVDRAFAEPLLEAFTQETGIEVHARFDTEAGKTTGLVNKLLAERVQPRADVWWSGEIFGTIELANAGVLAAYQPTTASDIPGQFRDIDDRWTAFGLRGRVIAFDPKRTRREDVPTAWADLAGPSFRERVALADPRFGTTRGHFAALLSIWGEDAFVGFLNGLKSNAVIRADGNSHGVLLLAQGRVEFAATDTDDVIVARSRGDSIDAVYPDMTSPDGKTARPGTLWIPSSVAMVKGARNEAAATQLIDYIASSRMEASLFDSDSRNIPVRAKLRQSLGVEPIEPARIDYRRAAGAMLKSAELIERVDPFRRR